MILRNTPAVFTVEDRVVARAIVTGALNGRQLSVAGTVFGRPDYLCEPGAEGTITWVIRPDNPKSDVLAISDARIVDFDPDTKRIAFRAKGKLLTRANGAYLGEIER